MYVHALHWTELTLFECVYNVLGVFAKRNKKKETRKFCLKAKLTELIVRLMTFCCKYIHEKKNVCSLSFWPFKAFFGGPQEMYYYMYCFLKSVIINIAFFPSEKYQQMLWEKRKSVPNVARVNIQWVLFSLVICMFCLIWSLFPKYSMSLCENLAYVLYFMALLSVHSYESFFFYYETFALVYTHTLPIEFACAYPLN